MRRFICRYLSPGCICRITKNKGTLFLFLLFLFFVSYVLTTNISLFTFPSYIRNPTPLQAITEKEAQLDNGIVDKKTDVITTTDIVKQPHKKGISNYRPLISAKKPIPCYDVHIFYYPWYGNPAFNKHYLHWNHKYLPHWSPEIAKMYPNGAHHPPDDIASNFYPELGAYSSNDYDVIKNHMQQLSFAGVGVVVVSYYPPGLADDNGEDWASMFPTLLKGADLYKIKVAFHIEPYKDRSEETVKSDIKNIIDKYGTHPAFYRMTYKEKHLPLVYIYDSYHTKPMGWARILKPGTGSIRGTDYDCIVIGLVVEQKHQVDMIDSGFDGFYTYFASSGFTFGSSRENWSILSNFAKENNLLYIPSVGPGYVDTRVRPWNSGNTRKRMKGQYYKESWKAAIKTKPQLVSVTSFNEWHEGTQIEKAVPKSLDNYKYLDYAPKEPNYYLVLTKRFIGLFMEMKKKVNKKSKIIRR